jgi:invasion protein IalB
MAIEKAFIDMTELLVKTTRKPVGGVLSQALPILLLQFALSNAVSAQTPPKPAPGNPPPAVSSETPQRTSATYDDWVLQCEQRAGPPPEKACQIAQVTQAQMQGKNVPFSLIAIPRPVTAKPVKVLVQLPVNVSLQASVRLQVDKADPGVATPFARCITSGCVAEFDLREDAIKKFKTAPGPGSINFKNANDQDVAVPLSFKGFAQAFDALLKE